MKPFFKKLLVVCSIGDAIYAAIQLGYGHVDRGIYFLLLAILSQLWSQD